jgi:lactate racemase
VAGSPNELKTPMPQMRVEEISVMDRIFDLPFGHEQRQVRLPEANIAWVTGPKDAQAVPDLKEAVLAALRAPIAAPGLDELVRTHGTRTVILVDDGTRSTPQKAILPVLLDELNRARVPDTEITVLIGLGTHRPMTEAECLERFGQAVVERVQVINLPQSPADFVDLGLTERGVPAQVSRVLVESQLSIAVGTIMPHMYAGWSGGAKMVQPAVSSPVTTAKTHLMAGPNVYEILGQVENPVRHEMEAVARKAGLKFILNFVLNCAGEVVAAVAGDVVAAHRRGVEIALPLYALTVNEPADIVVGSSHPADRDLWQGFKPVNNCAMLARDGGTLILLIPAPEGISHDHPAMLEIGVTPAEEVQRMVAAGEIADEVAAATSIAFDQTRKRVHVVLVTEGITPADGARIGLTATPDLEGALAGALEKHGPDARIGIVTRGADICGRVMKQ